MQAILIDSQGFTKTMNVEHPPMKFLRIPKKARLIPESPTNTCDKTHREFILVNRNESMAVYEEYID